MTINASANSAAEIPVFREKFIPSLLALSVPRTGLRHAGDLNCLSRTTA